MRGFYIDKVISIHKFSGSRPHWHAPAPRNVHYLAYHTAGKNTHIIRGKSWDIKEDTLLFISKEDEYDVYLTEETHSICVAFQSSAAPESFALSCEEYPQIRNAFLNLFSHKNIENPKNLFYCLKTVYDLFYLLEKEIKVSPSANRKDALRPAIEYIRENYLDGPISNEYLSALCGYGERRFISLFKEAYGKTPNQYIIHKKIANHAEKSKSSHTILFLKTKLKHILEKRSPALM